MKRFVIDVTFSVYAEDADEAFNALSRAMASFDNDHIVNDGLSDPDLDETYVDDEDN